MELGNKILELRKQEKLSQEQLAEIIGVTRQTISNWELEESSPDLKQAKELSRFFNISLDDLTGDSTFEYLGGNNRENEITIISSVENSTPRRLHCLCMLSIISKPPMGFTKPA